MALILGLLWFFAELVEAVLRNESANLDNNFGLWVHSFDNPWLDALFLSFTTLGNGLVILSLTVITFGLLLWRKHFRSAWLLLLTVGGGVLINQALKFFFQRPRPQLWADTLEKPDSFSFPSGHATLAFCYFGLLIWLGFKFLKHPPGKVLWATILIVCIAMVGLSRIYFGVHYLTDVVGGYVSGGLWLVILLNGVSIYTRLWNPARPNSQSNNSREGNYLNFAQNWP